jgi:hypothetical protein
VRNQCISVFSVVCVMIEFIHHSTGFHSDLSNLLVLAGKAERCGVVWWLLPFWSGGKGRDDSLSGNMMVSCAVSSLCGGIFGGVRLRHARGCSCRQSHDHGCPHRTPGSLCDFFFLFFWSGGSVCQIMSARRLANCHRSRVKSGPHFMLVLDYYWYHAPKFRREKKSEVNSFMYSIK